MSGEHGVPRMDWSLPNQADVFRLFKRRLELYFKVKAIEADDQVCYILLQVGGEGLRRYNSWTLTDDERKSATSIFQKFSDQLEPSENFRLSRLKLMNYRQRDNECLDDFINRCKLQALRCKFSVNETNERLLELIIASTPISEYQKKLLEKDDKYALAEAIVLGRTYEATELHVKQLKDLHSPDTAVHGIDKYSRNDRNCINCGYKHPFKPKDRCPAFGAECKSCGKYNHWASLCLSNKQKTHKPSHRSPSRERGRSNYRSQGGARKKTPKRHTGRNYLKTDSINEQSDTDEVDEHFEMLSFGDITVSSMKAQHDEVFANVKIKLSNRPGIHNLKLKVDTGAQGNTLPMSTFRRMYPDMLNPEGYPVRAIQIAAGHTRLTAYNGTQITCYGAINIPCNHGSSEWTNTKFYIVDVQGPGIIGLSSSEQLKLITLHCAINKTSGIKKASPIDSVDDLRRAYPGHFDKIGCMPGVVKLVVDRNVPPHVDAPRRLRLH